MGYYGGMSCAAHRVLYLTIKSEYPKMYGKNLAKYKEYTIHTAIK